MSKHFFPVLWVLFLFLMPCNVSRAQQCRDTIPGSIAPGRFIPLNNGTLLDKERKLVWMRCSVGQSWDNHTMTCVGHPTPLNWYRAMRSAETLARLSKQAWRLPSIQELSSITEMRCADPAIDLHWFPNTPAAHFWTGTPFVNQQGHFWLLQFLTGENNTDSAKRQALVRLVKPGE